VRAADVTEVGHALHTGYPVATELVIAADLAAADEVGFLTCAEVIRGNDHRAADLGDLGLLGAGPAAADVPADVAAGPVVGHDRSNDRPSLDGHICSEDRSAKR
jgi:hypothetical protein